MTDTSSRQVTDSEIKPKCMLLAAGASNSIVAAAQSMRERFSYLAYGGMARRTGLAPLLGFNGELLHGENGLYMLGNGKRVYSPALMRFFSADHFSPFGAGGINAYAYCKGDPINRIDPSGQVPVWIQKLIAPFSRRSSSASVTSHSLPATVFSSSLEVWDQQGLGYFGALDGAPHLY